MIENHELIKEFKEQINQISDIAKLNENALVIAFELFKIEKALLEIKPNKIIPKSVPVEDLDLYI